jgi:hypothetical protein
MKQYHTPKSINLINPKASSFSKRLKSGWGYHYNYPSGGKIISEKFNKLAMLVPEAEIEGLGYTYKSKRSEELTNLVSKLKGERQLRAAKILNKYKLSKSISGATTRTAFGGSSILAKGRGAIKGIGNAKRVGILAGAMLSVGAALAAKKIYESKIGRTRVSGRATKKQTTGERKESIEFQKNGHWITIRGGKRIFVQDKKGAAYTKAKAK